MKYTGVGSREVPPEMSVILADYAEALARAGYTLRSGGAGGCDTDFEVGADRGAGSKEIYLPWRGFNNSNSTLFGVTAAAMKIASTVHPAWDRLREAPQKLHGRNVYQVLGRSLSEPSDFLICWTKDGLELEKDRTKDSGGTATAVVQALRHNVPVFNLGKRGSLTRLNAFLTARGVVVPPHCESPVLTQAGLF
jgi:hypothetical protein